MQNNQNTNIEENEVQEESFKKIFEQIDPTQFHIFGELLKFASK